MTSRIGKLTALAAILAGGLLTASPSEATDGLIQGLIGAPGFKKGDDGKPLWGDYAPVEIPNSPSAPGAVTPLPLSSEQLTNAYTVSGAEFARARKQVDDLASAGAVMSAADYRNNVTNAKKLGDSTRFVLLRRTGSTVDPNPVLELPYDPRVTSVPAAARLGGHIDPRIARTLLIAGSNPAENAPPPPLNGILYGSDGFLAYQTEYMETVPPPSGGRAFGYCGDNSAMRSILITDKTNGKQSTISIFDPQYRFENCSLSAVSRILSPVIRAEVDSDATYAFGVTTAGDDGTLHTTLDGGKDYYRPLTGTLSNGIGFYELPYSYAPMSQFRANVWALIRYRPFDAKSEAMGSATGFSGVYYTPRRSVQAGASFQVVNDYSSTATILNRTISSGSTRTGLDVDSKVIDTHMAREANIAVPVAIIQGTAELQNEAPFDNTVPMGDPDAPRPGIDVPIDDEHSQTTYTYAKADFGAGGAGGSPGAGGASGAAGTAAGDAGVPPDLKDNQHHGLLSEINRVDLANTDFYVFSPDGDMLFERKHLLTSETDGLKCDPETHQCVLDPDGNPPFPARFHPQAVIPFRSTVTDVKVVLINRATGYVGTGRARVGVSGNETTGLLALRFDNPVILRPPNLKVRVERFAKGRVDPYVVGSEGSSLTSDNAVRVFTDWYDWDGSPLPAALPGYTGRLAKSATQKDLTGTEKPVLVPATSAQIPGDPKTSPGYFHVSPGRHSQILELPGNSQTFVGHYYVQIDGSSDLPQFQRNFDAPSFSQGPLKYRPRVYVPFLVPRFDEKATKAARDLLGTPADPTVFNQAAVYTWMYRPEMQFSMFELQAKLQVDAAPSSSDVDLTAETRGVSLSQILTNFVYGIKPDTSPMIEQTGPPRQLVFDIGGHQFTAVVDQTTHRVEFLDPTALEQLSPTDLLTLQLYQQNDRENVLWSSDRAAIKVETENNKPNVLQGDRLRATATITTTEKPFALDWSVEPGDPGAGGHIQYEDNDPDRHHAFIVGDEGSKDGWVRLRAFRRDDKTLYGEKHVYIGCLGCKKTRDLVALVNSVDFSINLGGAALGEPAGMLFVRSQGPTTDLFKPASLKAETWSANTEPISDANGIRQMVAPKSFTDIVKAPDNNGYVVSLYEPTARKPDKDPTTGTYSLVGNAQPVAKWVVENPTPGTADGKHVLITETRGTHAIETRYDWVDEHNGWTLTKGNGLVHIEQDVQLGAGNTRIDTRTVRDAHPNQFVQATTYTTFPWGERVTMDVVDPGHASLKTETFYFTEATDGSNAGKVKLVKNPDGSWVGFQYNAQGLKVMEVRPWRDTPPPGDGSIPSDGRVTHFDYNPVDGRDHRTARHFAEPRKVWEEVNGAVISTTFYAYVDDSDGNYTQIVERTQSASAGYGNAQNEHTETSFKSPESTEAGAGEITKRVLPDGRADATTYTAGTVDAQNAFHADPKGKGVLRVTVHGVGSGGSGSASPVDGKSTRETTVKDATGNIVLERTEAYIAGGYVEVGSVTRFFDNDGHVTKTTQSNGVVTEAHWDCCLTTTETDEIGRVTTTTPDDLKRPQLVETEHGPQGHMSVFYTYDAMGNVLTQDVTSGGITQHTENRYDGAGRLDSQTTPDHLTTTWQYSTEADHTVTVTITHPVNRTEIIRHYVDGRVKSITGSAVIPKSFSYDIDENGNQVTEVRIGTATPPRFQRTTTDMLGRVRRTEHPGPEGVETTTQSYNPRGLLTSTTRPGLADQIYEYDELGNRTAEGLDLDGDGELDDASQDRFSRTDTRFVQLGSGVWLQTERRVSSDAGATLTRTERSRLTNFPAGVTGETLAIDIDGNQTSSKVSLNRDERIVQRATNTPDSVTDTIETSKNGVVTSQDTSTGLHFELHRDGLGRVFEVVDPRTGTSVTHYDPNGRVDFTKTPDNAQTTYGYDAIGRQNLITNALGKTVRLEYNDLDQLIHRWGTATHPVELHYDDFGALDRQTTYRDDQGWTGPTWPGAAGGDVTTWQHDPATGLLQFEEDPAHHRVQFGYERGGRVNQRISARNTNTTITTTYVYNQQTGDLTAVNYTGGTPSLTFTNYDRLGRPKTVTDATGARTFEFNEALRVKSETIAGERIIKPKYETTGVKGRPTGLQLDSAYDVTYGYDTFGRLNGVEWTIGTQHDKARYGYRANSNLVDNISTDSGPSTQYDYAPQRNLRTKVQNNLSGATLSQYEPAYDPLGRVKSLITQGTALEQVAGSHWIYSYDDRDELTGAHRYQGTDADSLAQPLVQHDSDFTYDAAGNRLTENESTVPVTYTPNPLDQYTSRTAAGSSESFDHDLDGNLISSTKNGETTAYTYDAENRLTKVEPQSPTNGDLRADYKYDYRDRRVSKITYEWQGAWLQRETIGFVWDGWNLIAETKTPTSGSSTTCNYVWGLDVSQSIYGAGGIGGLVASVKNGLSRYYAYDANGNVGQVVEGGAIVAKYEYDPYGKLTAKSGPAADDNPFRFSTKYFDAESGFYYYGYRYYSTEWGRWTSSDPARDGTNLYRFVGNSPGNAFDALGLKVAHSDGNGGMQWDLEDWETQVIEESVVIARQIERELTSTCLSDNDKVELGRLKDDLLRQARDVEGFIPVESPTEGMTRSAFDYLEESVWDDGAESEQQDNAEWLAAVLETARQPAAEFSHGALEGLLPWSVEADSLFRQHGTAVERGSKAMGQIFGGILQSYFGYLLASGGAAFTGGTFGVGAIVGVPAMAAGGALAITGGRNTALGIDALLKVFRKNAKNCSDGDSVSRKWPKHHAFPSYLGGAVNQTLKKIPRGLHYKFHAALDKYMGGKYARSKGAEYFQKMNPKDVIRDLRKFYKSAEGGVFKKYLPDFEQAVKETLGGL